MSIIVKLEKPQFEEKGTTNKVFKALPEGDYQGIVLDSEIKTTKTKRPMLVLKFKLIGEKKLNGAMLDGRTEYLRLLLDSEWTGKIMNNILYSLGFNIEGGIDVQKMVDQKALNGRLCNVHLVESTYNKDGVVLPKNDIKYLSKIEEKEDSFSAIDDSDIPF